MRHLDHKNWFYKVLLLFLSIYLFNNLVVLGYKYIIDLGNYNRFMIYIFSLLPLIFYSFVIFFERPKINFIGKKINNSYLMLWLFFLIYLSSFIKSKYDYHYSEIQGFSILVLFNFFITIILGPFLEEIIFREILLSPFLKRKKINIGIIFTSLIFSLGHFLIINFKSFNLLDFIDLFIFGILLSIIRIRLGLLYAILAHSFRNLTAMLTNYGLLNIFFIEWIKNKYVFNVVYYLSVVIIFIYICYGLIQFKKNNIRS